MSLLVGVLLAFDNLRSDESRRTRDSLLESVCQQIQIECSPEVCQFGNSFRCD